MFTLDFSHWQRQISKSSTEESPAEGTLTASGSVQQAGAMSSTVRRTKLPWGKIIGAVVVLAIAGVVLLRAGNFSALLEQVKGFLGHVMDVIRAAGPWVFFLAMAVLPGLGVPMLAFVLTAGSAFGDQLGMPLVVVLCVTATTANLIITYWLARKALHPLFLWLVKKLGYKLPKVQPGDQNSLIIIMRVTPGIPFFVQNYLLGLAEVPFARYLWISFALSTPQTIGFVIFGDALTQGKGKMVIAAVGLLVAASLGTQLLRKRYAGKKGAA